jgi:hypothetical protein
VVAGWSARTLLNLDRGMIGFDTLWYHMPFAARFVQDASIVHLHFTDPLYLNWFYPQSSELLHGLGILLFRHHDVLSPLLNLGFLGLALLAAWCAGRPHGAGALAVLAVAVVLDAPLLVSRAGEANNDIVGLAFFLCAVAFLLNGAATGGAGGRGTGEAGAEAGSAASRLPPTPVHRGPLLLAALAGGLAIGTKLTLVAPVALLTVGLVTIAKRGARTATAVIWLTGLIVTGSFWYLRNLIAVGNPVPWVELGPLPTPERLLHGRPDFSVAHYLTDTDIWGRWFAPGLEDGLGIVWWAVLALGVIGILLAVSRRRPSLERMLAAVGVAGAVAYLFTPLSASGPEGEPIGFAINLRYLAPPLCLGLILFATSPQLQGGRRKLAAFVALAAILVIGDEPFSFLDSRRALGAAGIGIAITIALLLPFPLRRPEMPAARRRTMAAVAALVLVAAAAQGYRIQRDYLEGRYAHPQEKFGLAAGFNLARDLRDERIGIVGTSAAFVQYGLYGTELSNRVQYIGDPGKRGAFSPILDCARWRRAVNEGEYTFVITAPQFRFQAPRDPAPSPERRWIAGDPVAELVRRSGDVVIFRITGPLDPNRCPRKAPPFPLEREQRDERLTREELRS